MGGKMATFVGFWSRFVEDSTTRKQFYRAFASMMIDSTFLATFLDQKSTLVLESSLHSSFLQSPATASWCRSFTKNCRFDTAVSARFRFRNFGWYRYSKYKIQNTRKYLFFQLWVCCQYIYWSISNTHPDAGHGRSSQKSSLSCKPFFSLQFSVS